MTATNNRAAKPPAEIADELEALALPQLQKASQVLEHLLNTFSMSRAAVSNTVQAARATKDALAFTEAAIAALESEVK